MVIKLTTERARVSPSSSLERILGQVPKIRMIRFLVKTNWELSGREIAAAVGLSHVKAHTALKELNHYNVVEMHRAGKSILYRLNLKNALVRNVLIPLFENELRLIDTVARTLRKYLKKSSPKSVILFGSFALDSANPDSDIDVLVIASKKRDIPAIDNALQRAEYGITSDFGNKLAPIVLDEADFRGKFKNKNKLIMAIVREGKVLFGDSLNDLIKSND